MQKTLAPLRGQGFSGSSPSTQDDNMFSTDLVEMLIAVSEGPIKGFVDGAKSFYAGDTPFKDAEGESNVGQFDLTHRRGSEAGAEIISKLGGFGVSTSTNAPELVYNVPVVRQGSHGNNDYIDLRIVINRLGKDDEDGSHNNHGYIKIEYRKVGASTWRPIKTTTNYPPPGTVDDGANQERHRITTKKKPKVSASPGDRVAYWQLSTPPTTEVGSIWFDTGSNNRPKRINDAGVWVNSNDATLNSGVWSWKDKSAWGNDQIFKAYVQLKKPKTAKQGDFWLRPPNTDLGETIGLTYLYNGNSFNIAAGSLSPSSFGGGSGTTEILADGVIHFEGRVSSPTPKEFRIPVDPTYAGSYEFQVTNITDIDDDEHFFSVTWESFQEVTKKAYNFPGLATTQVVVGASDQFTSIPDMWGIYDGRIVKVPSNYDPVARTYETGVWNGTWKNAYTNNPAYLGKDLIDNDRYGMNTYYDVVLRDIDVYAAGQWCDVRCADGNPRFTFNGSLTEPRNGREAVNYMFGIFGGRFFDDGDGQGVIKIDDDAPGSMLFTPENVVDGRIIYGFTDTSSRANYYTVTFVNPDLDWEVDKRLVKDDDHIEKYGRIPASMEAIGCTDEREAVRRAKYKLITSTTETITANFKTNRLGLYAEPYQVILISDDAISAGLSGRIQSTPSRSQIVLRDPIYLEPGFNYTISFQYLNDVTWEIQKININNGMSGSLTTLNLQSNLPLDIPENMVFSVERRDGTAAPRAFRIMSINEVDSDPDNIEIQCIEVNRNKWLYVDGYLHSPLAVERVNLGRRALPKAVGVVRCKAESVKSGRHRTYNVELDWTKSPSKKVVRYGMYYSVNGSSTVKIGETKHTRFPLNHIPRGDYVFSITAITADNFESEPNFIEHRLQGDISEFDDIENLTLVDAIGTNQYEERNPTIRWDELESTRHDKYVIQILEGSTVLKTYRTENNRFRYTFADNKADHRGVASREIKFGLASKSDSGKVGDFTYLTINNPAPPTPGFTITQRGTTMQIDITKTTSTAIEGYLVWMVEKIGEATSFTPSGLTPGAGNCVYDSSGRHPVIDVKRGKPYLVVVAAYDTFGKSGLNQSTPITTTAGKTVSDGQTLNVPTNLAANSIVDVDNSGHVRSLIRFGWAMSTEDLFDHYEIEIREDGAEYTSVKKSTNRHRFVGKPGAEYRYRVRACDGMGNKSAFTEWNLDGNPDGNVNVATGASRTDKPEQATITSAVARVKGIKLRVSECGDKDYKTTRYWRYVSFNDARDDFNRIYLGTHPGEVFIDNDNLDNNTNYWYRAAHVNKSDVQGDKSAATEAVKTVRVQFDDINDDAIRSNNIKDGEVGDGKLGDNSTGTKNIKAGAISGGGSAKGKKAVSGKTSNYKLPKTNLFKKSLKYTNRSGAPEFISINCKLNVDLSTVLTKNQLATQGGKNGKAVITVSYFIKRGAGKSIALASYKLSSNTKTAKITKNFRELLLAPKGGKGLSSQIWATVAISGQPTNLSSGQNVEWSASCETTVTLSVMKA